MTGEIKAIVFWALLLCGAIFLARSSAPTQYVHNYCEAYHYDQENCGGEDAVLFSAWKVGEFLTKHHEEIIAACTIIIAIFTIALWLIGWRTSQRQLRAYVVVKTNGYVGQRTRRNIRLEIRPVLFNSGQTPAYDMQVASRFEILSSPPPRIKRPFKSKKATSKVTLGPQQDRFHGMVYRRLLSFGELREIYKGEKKRIYIWGSVVYRDCFHRERYTNFCFAIWFTGRRNTLWHTEAHSNNAS